MNPLHPVVARELAVVQIQHLHAAADLDRATRLATASTARTRRDMRQRPIAVECRVPSRRRAQVYCCR